MILQKMIHYIQYIKNLLKKYNYLILYLYIFIRQKCRFIITFQSSGSTENNLKYFKYSYHNLFLISKAILNELPFKNKKNTIFIYTVPKTFIYGGIAGLFNLLQYRLCYYPYCKNINDIKNMIIKYKHISIFTTPSQLQQFLNDKTFKLLKNNIDNIMCAGGICTPKLKNICKKTLGINIIDIYGATELGLIGYAYKNNIFNLSRQNKFININNNSFSVYNKILNKTIKLDDIIKIISKTKFKFISRSSRIIKINEQFINLNYVEQKIIKLLNITDCYCLYKNNKLFLLLQTDKNFTNIILRQKIKYLFPQGGFPTKIKITNQSIRTNRGKILFVFINKFFH